MQARFLRSLFSLALAATVTHGAAVALSDDSAMLIGPGAVSCGDFGSFYKMDPDYFGSTYYAWAQGYMSGINAALAAHGAPITDLGRTSAESQKLRLMSYCDKHPLGIYFQAVEQLFADMRAKQGLPDWRRTE